MSVYQRIAEITPETQQLQRTQWGGIEYDNSVPREVVVGTPGGTATSIHHWTKGLYGMPNSFSDGYAGQGYQYITSNFADLYKVGNSSGLPLTNPPDPKYWENEGGGQKGVVQENFDIGSTIDLITPADTTVKGGEKSGMVQTGKLKLYPTWELFALFLLVYIMFDLWSDTAQSYLAEFHGGSISPAMKLLYASIITVVFFVTIYFAGLSFTVFENE